MAHPIALCTATTFIPQVLYDRVGPHPIRPGPQGATAKPFAIGCAHLEEVGIASDLSLEGHEVVEDCYPLYAPGSAPRLREILTRLTAESRARLERERALLERLEAVRESSPTQWEEVLEAVSTLRSLQSNSSQARLNTALTATERMPARALVAALLTAGISESDIRNIVGGNILRVWAEVERVAAVMQAGNTPILEDDEPKLLV